MSLVNDDSDEMKRALDDASSKTSEYSTRAYNAGLMGEKRPEFINAGDTTYSIVFANSINQIISIKYQEGCSARIAEQAKVNTEQSAPIVEHVYPVATHMKSAVSENKKNKIIAGVVIAAVLLIVIILASITGKNVNSGSAASTATASAVVVDGKYVGDIEKLYSAEELTYLIDDVYTHHENVLEQISVNKYEGDIRGDEDAEREALIETAYNSFYQEYWSKREDLDISDFSSLTKEERLLEAEKLYSYNIVFFENYCHERNTLGGIYQTRYPLVGGPDYVYEFLDKGPEYWTKLDEMKAIYDRIIEEEEKLGISSGEEKN